MEKAVISLLATEKEPLTTAEIIREMDKMKINCKDSPIHFLNRLKKKEIVKCKFSKEKKAIIWSLCEKVKVR